MGNLKEKISDFKSKDLTKMNDALVTFLQEYEEKGTVGFRPIDYICLYIDIVKNIYSNQNLNEIAPDEYQQDIFFAEIMSSKKTKKDIIFKNLSYIEFYNEKNNPPFLGFKKKYWESLCGYLKVDLKYAKQYLNAIEDLTKLCKTKIYKQYDNFCKSKYTIKDLLDGKSYVNEDLYQYLGLTKLIKQVRYVNDKYGSTPKILTDIAEKKAGVFSGDLKFSLGNLYAALNRKKESTSFNGTAGAFDFMVNFKYHIMQEIDSIIEKLNQLNKLCNE